jgi:menaquinone-dependent protoporphyrinogen oxidase
VSRVLVTYGSKHGSTAEIAEAVAEAIRRGGHDVDCVEAGQARDVASYDAVVLGSAVYMKRWRREAKRLLSRERPVLADRPLWVFSSGPFGDDPDPAWSEPADVVKTVEKLGAREHVVFGGRLPLEPSNFIERAIADKTPVESRDLRDWDEIRRWAGGIAAQLAAAPAAQARDARPGQPAD